MQPWLRQGDVALVDFHGNDAISTGEIVVIRDSSTGKLFAHRLVNSMGKYKTKGDANTQVEIHRSGSIARVIGRKREGLVWFWNNSAVLLFFRLQAVLSLHLFRNKGSKLGKVQRWFYFLCTNLIYNGLQVVLHPMLPMLPILQINANNEAGLLARLFSGRAAKNALKKEAGLTHYGAIALQLSRENILPKRQAYEEVNKRRKVQEVLALEVLKELDRALEKEQKPAILLKGLGIAYRYWPKPVFRSFSDIDILVRPEDFAWLCSYLENAGATRDADKGKWQANDFKQVYFYNNSVIEVHSQLFYARNLSSEIWNHARPTKVPGLLYLQEFGSDLQFVYLCGHHGFQHLFDEIYWLLDIYYLLITEEENLNWYRIEDLARKLEFNTAVGVSLSLVQRHLGWRKPSYVPEFGSLMLNTLVPFFITPARIFKYSHAQATPLYLLIKALLRDSWSEILNYSKLRLRRSSG